MASQTNEHQLLHKKAMEHLDMKMKCVRFSSFRKPTIWQIYANKCHIPEMTLDLQLDFFFEHWDTFRRYQFCVQKMPKHVEGEPQHVPQEINIVRAIFHYEMDKDHSFTARHRVIRWNLALMVMYMIKMDNLQRSPLEEQRFEFCVDFVTLWTFHAQKGSGDDVEARPRDAEEEFFKNWTILPQDLIQFGPAQEHRMKMEMRGLRAEVERIAPEAFVETRHSFDGWKEHGPAYGIYWIMTWQQHCNDSIAGVKNEEGVADMGIEGSIAGMALEDEPMSLQDVNWNAPVIQALLKDPGPEVQQAKFKANPDNFWISVHEASELMEGSLVSVTDWFDQMQM